MNLQTFKDGFQNLLAGIGGGNPKTSANEYGVSVYTADQLDAAYRSSTWFAKIVDAPADDAVREWRAWQTDKESIEKLTNVERALGVRKKIREALIASRIFGGAVIYLGGLKGEPSQPVDPNTVNPGDLKFLTVFNRFEIDAGEIETDPASPYFRLPRFYRLNTQGGTLNIHASRMVVINGRRTSVASATRDAWGDPLWMRLRDAVTNADSGSSIISALLLEAKSDVVSVDNLIANMATQDYTDLLVKRFQYAAMVKSVSNVTILDKQDEWDQKQITWTGLPDVVRLLLVIMAGAADIPVTRLIGTSATGLNATGEGDLKNYYDRVRSDQENVIEPALTVLDRIVMRSALGNKADGIWYTWVPLWQPTEKERSEQNKADAEADRTYADAGLVPIAALAKSVQNRMIESGKYPGLDEALKDPSLAEGDPAPDDTDNLLVDAAPQTLYVSRKVKNADEILKWARKQGFKSPVAAADLHVTIIYTKSHVDWMKAGHDWYGEEIVIDAGGPRVMEDFNDDAKVLSFSASRLSWRHEDIKRATGAETTYPNYQPHITISYENISLEGIEPYTGRIVLGPEIFAKAD